MENSAKLKRRRRAPQLALITGLAGLLAAILVLGLGAQATARPQSIAVGFVTDEGGLDDMSFNWFSYQGLLRAEGELGVAGTVYTSTTPADYEPNLQQCVDDGNDLCFAVGFGMANATLGAAQANTDTAFAIVDSSWDSYPDNLRGMIFAADEAAYLAGTLAGLMTESDVIGDIGGMSIPPVDLFVYGYRNGARCANPNVDVLIGYTGSFADPDLGAQEAQGMMAQGADVIFAVAGPSGVGAVLTATQSGVWGIGVDTDWYVTTFMSGTVAGSNKLLSSAMKRMDNAVFDTIDDVVSGIFTSGTVLYDLAADGVGLAPFHEADASVPQSVRDALEQVRQGIVDGTIEVNDPCWAPSLYVDGATGSDDSDCTEGGDPCTTIGYALTQAGNGDEIRVAQGTYTENLNIDGKTLTLRGGYAISGTDWLPGTGETIVDGNGADRTFLIQGNNSVLENLTITGGDTPDDQCWGGGVWVTNGDVTIRDSLVTGNWADCSGAGVEVNSDFGPAHLTLVDSIVFDNHSGGECGGVSVWHTGAHLTNTLIVSNTGGNGSALRIEDSDVTVQNCTIADNSGGDAINAYDCDAQPDVLTLRSSIVWGNMDGNLNCAVETCDVTYSDIGGGWAGTGNIDADPQFVDPSGGDYHLQAWSPCIDSGTADGAPDHDFEGDPRPQNAGFDMGADEFTGTPIPPGLLFVDGATGSDSTECRNPAAPCETIGYALTQAGNGDEIRVAQGTYTENLKITQGNTITLRGGYAISGTVWIPAESGATVVNGNRADSTIEIRYESNTTLENITVTGGQGIDDPTFGAGCGGFKIQDSDVTIRASSIISNVAAVGDGGAICAAGDSRDITLTVEDTIVSDNDGSGRGGALNLYHTTAFLTNVLIYGNTADHNSVLQVYQAGSHVTFQNCTISDNTPTGSQAIYIADPDTLTVRNSILWNNGQSIAVGEGEHSCTDCVTVTYSDIEGGWTGTGNIDADPMFADAASGDYHLGVGSPCIDAGTPAGAPAADVEGTPRDAAPDMGAYEWTGFRIFLPLTLKNAAP